jgi:hypothetical protein
MIFSGGCEERVELRLQHMNIKRPIKTASPATTAITIPAMNPALSAEDAFWAGAAVETAGRFLLAMTTSGEIAEAFPSAIRSRSFPAEVFMEAKAADQSCRSQKRREAVAMRLTCSVQHTFWCKVAFHLCWQYTEAIGERHIICNNQQQELLTQAVLRDVDKKIMYYCGDKVCKHTSLYVFCDMSIGEVTELITLYHIYSEMVHHSTSQMSSYALAEGVLITYSWM